MVDLTVNSDGLRAAGNGLLGTATGVAGAAPRCDPAATDPVSLFVAATLTQWSHVLWTLMEHAGQQREAGGLSITGTADYLGAVDAAGAAQIAATAADGSRDPAMPGPSLPAASAPVPVPVLPSIPQMTAPLPLTGEQFSAMVHSEPGPDRLRAFAHEWRNTVGPHILATADHTRRYGNSIQQDWDDGQPAAATNVLRHADWLESSLHASALGLADSAEQAAGHAETVIQSTPSPQEFRDIRTNLNTALAHFRASGGLNGGQVLALTNQLGEKQGMALAGYQTYAASAPVTTAGASQPPSPAPPIVHGDGSATIDRQANQLNPGSHRGNRGHGDADGQGAGGDRLEPSTADFGPPLGSSGNPPVAPAQPAAFTPPAVDQTANLAGTIMGAGIGAVGQLAKGLNGISGGGSPLSALSGLSSLPGMGGMPHLGTPQTPGDGAGDSAPALGNDHDFGSGGTTPADGGGGGGGDGVGGAPISSSSPAISAAPSAASPSVGTPALSAPTGVPATAGGPGMFGPPMMGGLGRGNDEGRKPNNRRRVVMRPAINSEPVFGEVERKHSTRRSAPPKEEP
jgi:hypothetical protein